MAQWSLEETKWIFINIEYCGICFCHAMLCISAAYAVMLCLCFCLSVRPSVMFVDHVKTNKHIFKIFSPSGSHIILVFPYQTGWRYSDGNPSNGGVECRWGRQKRDSAPISGFAAYMSIVYSVINRTSRELWKTKPSFIVRTRRRRSVCDGLDVIRRWGQTPRTQPPWS